MQPLGQRHREGIGTLGHRAENDGLCVGKFRHGDLGALMAANKAVKVEKQFGELECPGRPVVIKTAILPRVLETRVRA
jgi:hypothetical protein